MKRSATQATAADAPAADGRVRRSQRSGQAIVNALIALVGAGVLEPTAQQVAARAGVGLRTVFRRFSDMESLFAEMDARLQAEALPLLIAGQQDGNIEERARGLVRHRVAFFERIAPFKRSGNLKRQRSPFLRDRHARLVRALRAELLRWLPEVRRAPASVADALDLATSFEAWDRLRTDQGLARTRAHAAMEQMVLALLGPLVKMADRKSPRRFGATPFSKGGDPGRLREGIAPFAEGGQPGISRSPKGLFGQTREKGA